MLFIFQYFVKWKEWHDFSIYVYIAILGSKLPSLWHLIQVPHSSFKHRPGGVSLRKRLEPVAPILQVVVMFDYDDLEVVAHLNSHILFLWTAEFCFFPDVSVGSYCFFLFDVSWCFIIFRQQKFESITCQQNLRSSPQIPIVFFSNMDIENHRNHRKSSVFLLFNRNVIYKRVMFHVIPEAEDVKQVGWPFLLICFSNCFSWSCFITWWFSIHYMYINHIL